jgi:hypothetical protein
MTPPTDHDDPHSYAIALVHEIASSIGLTTIAKISENDEMVWATTESFLPRTIDQANYGGLLHAAAELERRYPRPDNPVFACALVLPEHDIAYLHDATATGAAAGTLSIGPNPHDNPDIREAVMDGLAALMQAVLDAQRPSRTSARAFANHPHTPASRPPSRPDQDYLNPPPLNGHRHNGPHR